MKIKSNNCYLMPLTPVFNPDNVPLFENFDKEHSTVLWSTLYMNAVEVLESYNNSSAALILDESDLGFIPEKIKSKEILTGNIGDRKTLLRNLNEKSFRHHENNIIFISSAVGYTHKDITKAFNLLNINDDTLVLGRSTANNKICFAGFNTYPEIFDSGSVDYEHILAESCKHNSLLYTLEDFIFVNSSSDFKRLYVELSKKDSLTYCSQRMHELFTHLFIEYKDLLK